MFIVAVRARNIDRKEEATFHICSTTSLEKAEEAEHIMAVFIQEFEGEITAIEAQELVYKLCRTIPIPDEEVWLMMDKEIWPFHISYFTEVGVY